MENKNQVTFFLSCVCQTTRMGVGSHLATESTSDSESRMTAIHFDDVCGGGDTIMKYITGPAAGKDSFVSPSYSFFLYHLSRYFKIHGVLGRAIYSICIARSSRTFSKALVPESKIILHGAPGLDRETSIETAFFAIW